MTRHRLAAPFRTPTNSTSLLLALAAVVLAALAGLLFAVGMLVGLLTHPAGTERVSAPVLAAPALALPAIVLALLLGLFWWSRRRERRAVPGDARGTGPPRRDG